MIRKIDNANFEASRSDAVATIVALMLVFSIPAVTDSGVLNAQEAAGQQQPANPVESTGGTADQADASQNGENAEAQAETVMQGSMTPEMSKLFPIGRPFQGVRIPSYNGDTLNSVVTSEIMRRVDDEHLDLEKLVIITFGRGEEADTRIIMDRAIYDMTEGKLTSRTPTRIIREQFEMRGDKMVFDSNTQVGHMTGNIRMTIMQVDQVLPESKLETPGSGSTTP